MLDPEYMERAGEIVGEVYAGMEAEMCEELVRAMLAGDVGEWRVQTALVLLAQGEAAPLRAILERHRKEIDEAVREEVEGALMRSDAYDLEAIKQALGVTLPAVTSVQVAGVARTVTEMLERDNIEMLQGARDAFYRESAQAVTEASTGLTSPAEATRAAAMRLARRGITTVQYRDPTTGNRTVANRIDVAVRRHVRTQLAQACANRTMQVCQESGCRFVEVSSHFGARPSHQDWEGRRYCLDGRVTVDGVTYEDFGEATGYYGTGDHGALGDRLQGVNCRHHFGPWMPGMPHAFEPNPQHPSGKSNEEIYDLTQRQRALERSIRDAKRELSAARECAAAQGTDKAKRGADVAKMRLKRLQERIKSLVADNSDVLARQVERERA